MLRIGTGSIKCGVFPVSFSRRTLLHGVGLVQFSFHSGASIAQSVLQLATGWTIRRSNPGVGEIFRTRPDRSWGPPSLLYNGYWFFPGGEAAGAWL